MAENEPMTQPVEERPAYPLLDKFSLYGWKPNQSLTDDENYMDIVLLVTRSSVCTAHGHVGCLLVDPTLVPARSNETQADLERRICNSVIGAATNASLFNEADSDIHAEIACLGQACKNRNSTENATAYITIHPCKRCFAALVAFGVKRIVSRQLPPRNICQVAEREGMAVAELTREMNRLQMKRINEIFNVERTDEELMEDIQRRRRWRAERKKGGRKETDEIIQDSVNENAKV